MRVACLAPKSAFFRSLLEDIRYWFRYHVGRFAPPLSGPGHIFLSLALGTRPIYKIALTGAAGFTGSHAGAALRRAKFSVRALAGPQGEKRRVESLIAEETLYGDITDPNVLDELVAGAEVVVHAAGPPLSRELEAIVLRLFSVYGPGMSEWSVVSECFARAAERNVIRIRDPRPRRDFCFRR